MHVSNGHSHSMGLGTWDIEDGPEWQRNQRTPPRHHHLDAWQVTAMGFPGITSHSDAIWGNSCALRPSLPPYTLRVKRVTETRRRLAIRVQTAC